MTFAELWLTYQLASRAHLKNSATTQLIELEFQNHKLTDLEDVLEHGTPAIVNCIVSHLTNAIAVYTVFRQGFVEAQYRPLTWWEKKDGQKVKASHSVEELLVQGVGRCPETALKLIVQDVPTSLWFTYVYRHNASAPAVVQRVKLVGTETHGRLELLANVTNHIFKEGFLAAKLRPLVHWETPCGNKFEEHIRVQEILAGGVGSSEEKPLRLIVDAPHVPAPGCHKPAPIHVPVCHTPVHHIHHVHEHEHHAHEHYTYSPCH
ncbi:hypothetical protein DXG03_004616 [Asterophora parasitica]|uniref:Uncharacterized protein n=1 Tax=Asterophora parasitica TaxID=117018 RepID=A0A9P7G8U1_9AGAR|nr:hypothetical protein DXG03_004616 [Asterophora parasitica]